MVGSGSDLPDDEGVLDNENSRIWERDVQRAAISQFTGELKTEIRALSKTCGE